METRNNPLPIRNVDTGDIIGSFRQSRRGWVASYNQTLTYGVTQTDAVARALQGLPSNPHALPAGTGGGAAIMIN